MQGNGTCNPPTDQCMTSLEDELSNLGNSTCDVLHRTYDEIDELNRRNVECANRVRKLEARVRLTSLAVEANQTLDETSRSLCDQGECLSSQTKSSHASRTVSEPLFTSTNSPERDSLKEKVGRLFIRSGSASSVSSGQTVHDCETHHSIPETELDKNTRIDNIQSKLKEKEVHLLTLKRTHKEQEEAIYTMRAELRRLRAYTATTSESNRMKLNEVRRMEMVLMNKVAKEDRKFCRILSASKKTEKIEASLNKKLSSIASKATASSPGNARCSLKESNAVSA